MLLDILCALSFALSLTLFLALSLTLSFVLSLITFPCLLGCNISARSFLYIVGFNKQSYVELVANQYRCFIGYVWRYNVYFVFCSLQPIRITHCFNTGLSTVSLTIALYKYHAFYKYHDIIFRSFLLQSGNTVSINIIKTI